MKRSSCGAVALTVLLAAISPGGLSGQVIRGTVTDASTEGPIQGARVRLFDLDGRAVATADSDEEGTFELRPGTEGLFIVSAERIGYASFRSEPVNLAYQGDVSVRLRLGVDAIPLTPFVVLVDTRLQGGRLAEFERRRTDPTISGHFLGAEDVRARPTATPTQLLRALPTVDLYQVQTVDDPLGMDRSLIFLPGSRGGSLKEGECLAQVFVNGVPVQQSQSGAFTVDDYLGGVPIAGVELYTRAFSAPPQYRGTGECGVVLYWTEEPQPSKGGWGVKRIAVGVAAIVGVIVLGFAN